jgi:hypothetical protein
MFWKPFENESSHIKVNKNIKPWNFLLVQNYG